MREIQFASFFMLILSAILIFSQNELRACSCVPPPPPAEEFQDSDAVFIGTVTSFKVVDSDPHSAANRKAKIRLLKLWKGDRALVSEVFTGLNSAGCGFDFEVGETYLIYAFMNASGELRTNICTRTASLEQAGEDLIFLEQKDPFFTQEDSGCCGSVSGGDALLAGGVLLFLLRRKSKKTVCQKLR